MHPPGISKIKGFFHFWSSIFGFETRFFFDVSCQEAGEGAVWGMVFAVFVGQKHGFYSAFVLLAYRNYILQHGENCVNTSVFARHWHKTSVFTALFALKISNICETHRQFGDF